MLSKRFIQLFVFVVIAYMSSKKQPCPKCGCGVFELGSNKIYSHLKYCKEIEEKDHNNDNTGDAELPGKTTNSHACTDRGVSESILNTELDSFKLNNKNGEGWELHEHCGSSERGSSEGSIKDDEAHVTNNNKIKYPFMKNIPIPGNIVFQI